ncbi:MAG TPA: type II secretion system F family protein, partial [Candidatus Dormibacteraeota bacterium]|nr:type II secretion system F family protein [Candidatus Dormibacteraeota bacterium]
MVGKFTYRAYSPRGRLEERVASGDSAAAVHRDLLDRGYRVVSVRPARSGWRWIYRQFPTFFRVKTADLILFSRQLATFIRVGVPITDAIRLLQDASGSGAFRAALEDIHHDLEGGESFSAAIAHHPSVFNELYVDMVRAAEYSGTLDRV